MPRSSRKDTLKWYKHELERAKRYRDEQGYDALWERMIDMYRGKLAPTVETSEDYIVVNVAFGTINVIAPSVSVNYPKIAVNPTHPEDEDRALMVEAITNYNWKHFNIQDEFRLAVKDYLIVGHGWLKTGYRFREQEVSVSEDESYADFEAARTEVDTFAAQNPALAGDLPSDVDLVQTMPTTKIVVAEDRPYAERVSPFDIYVDPEATTLDNARWICQRIIRPIEEVKRDERYKASARARVESDMQADNHREQQRSMFRRGTQDPADQRVTIWEWYDIRRNTMAVCAEGSDEFLVDPQPSPFAFGHPFIMVRNYDVPDFFYPMGELEAIEPLIGELNKSRTQMMGVRQKFARKLMYREGAFSPAGRQALQSDADNVYVPVADENTPFDQLVMAVPQVQVPPELWNHFSIIEEDINNVSGVSEYQRGQKPETRQSATEAAIISDSINARSADKLAQIEKATARVARRMVQLQQQFMTQVQVANVVGDDRAMYWIAYDAEDISGEFDFEVEAGSTQPMNATARRQEATALAQAMQPFVDMGVVDPRALAQHLLQYGFQVPNPSKFLMSMDMGMGMPGQPPMEGGGVGGPQGAPMGPGFMDESGNMANEFAG